MTLIILLNLLYALMFTLSKFSLLMSQPIFSTGARTFLGGLISLWIYSFYDPDSPKITYITFTQWILLFFIALIQVYVCNSLEIFALQYVSVGKATFVYNLGPFFAAIFSYFAFSEYMTWQKLAGLCLGFLGFIPVFMESSLAIDTTVGFGFLSLAECALLGAVISAVIGATLMKALLKNSSLSIFFINGIALTLGGAFCFLHTFFYENAPFVYHGYLGDFLKVTIIIALLKYVIAFCLNIYLLKRYSITLLAFFGFTISLFGASFGYLFFGEPISVNFIISFLLVITGLFIFYREELRQGYIERKL